MKNILNLYKPIGITPFQLIEKFKEKNPEYQDQKLGYAGRLDPMAEGVLLVLVGEENKKRKEYERLKKEYEFDVLFGIKTDSYDVLGKIIHCHTEFSSASKNDEILNSPKGISHFMAAQVQDDVKKYIGKHLQLYPPYSSPRVKGKPLFWWAREGRLSEIEIPKKEIEIYDFKIVKTYQLTVNKLQVIIEDKISKIKGAFRQKEILKGWKQFFGNCCSCHAEFSSASQEILKRVQDDDNELKVFTFKISCSSGTYIRSIANEMGGIALNIKRTRVGNYVINESIK